MEVEGYNWEINKIESQTKSVSSEYHKVNRIKWTKNRNWIGIRSNLSTLSATSISPAIHPV